MERIAKQPPLKCFGLEQDADNPACPACPHRRDCAEHMGTLARRVPVDRTQFSLVPDMLQERGLKEVYDPDANRIEAVYYFCHKWVFGFKPRTVVGRHRDAILQRVRESKTSLKLFLLSNLLGWKQGHPQQDFSPKLLTSETSVSQVKTYAEACHRNYGSFDTTTLDRFTGSRIAQQDFENLLLASELTAGSWIIGYKLFNSGQVSQTLYRQKELCLHPYWLAIEHTYMDAVLRDHIDLPEPGLPDVLCRHRWETSHILGQLKSAHRLALAVFRAREEIMPEAIRHVLALRGFQPNDFMVDPQKIEVNPIGFWTRLAVAIQHYECLNLVDGLPSIYRPR